VSTPGRSRQERLREWQPRFWARLLLLIAIGVYVIAFILENRHDVHVHFVLFTATVSLIWLILLCVGLGVVAGALLRQLHRRGGRN
jgi:uncharacterized integral membrane protein